MATNILMPALSPTMTEGTLARWLKKTGETVKAGDIIAEIETDKATMEVEAVDEGVLGKILVADGTEGVKVNAPIAILVAEGEAVPDDVAAPATGAPKSAPTTVAPAAQTAPTQPAPAQAAPAQVAAQPAAQSQPNGAGGSRIIASPLAKRIAKEHGVDLSGVTGSGPNGRIVRADVEAAQSQPAAAPKAEAPAAAAPAAAKAPAAAAPKAASITAPHQLVPHTSMRRVIAKRLTESKQTVPHFYLTMDIELDALLKLRGELNARSAKDGGGAFKLSVNDMVIKASALALRRVPKVNASFLEEGVAFYDDVDISVAVAIPDGLITPIIRRADQKGLATISNEMKDLGLRARAGKLKPEEFQGGGFSVSNLGMFGVKDFQAIINPPQAAILAVGAGEQRPVVKNGALAIATVMSATLSVDHRVVDGALGAEWLQAFKAILEEPLNLML
ncbi:MULTISPECIES: pyruvate dehydrogenase complex dihydrolipoamide acetyltransferase [unclassified Acidisoma]|jgi:pyruvate dehydrogenase E2 component (dihydrolipoamide acetyltransferase)|uniref:pyruvate dehydrogenase complex dihydrolipoamide acetyltransferase n=1 Tax=unclassified Acidisoma TaxID=2634065 RepID=UPI00131E4F14|nr:MULTISPECIES: pyruvate dehydrogenase complex dihydrolipoamide acetyltransferase [unclassified Acidisoma]